MKPHLEPAWNPELARGIVRSHYGVDGALLPILQAIRPTFGCVPAAAWTGAARRRTAP